MSIARLIRHCRFDRPAVGSLAMVIFAATAISLCPMIHAAPAATHPSNLINRTESPALHSEAVPSTAEGSSPLRVVLSLGAVLGLIVLMYWGGRRLLPASASADFGAVQVLSRTHLSSKQRVLLLRVGRRVLVIADSAGQLTTLCNIDDAEEVEELSCRLLDHPRRQRSLRRRQAADRFPVIRSIEEPAPEDPQDAAFSGEDLGGLIDQVRAMANDS